MLTGELKRELGPALAAIPSGAAVMTAVHDGQSTGMLASWVQQACFEPPMVSVAVKQTRPVVELVEGSRRFVICPIGEDPAAMFRHFGKGFAPGEDAFSGIETKAVEGGIVPAGCMGYLVCALRERTTAGDHFLYLGEVVAGGAEVGRRPYVHVRKSGFSY